MASALPEWHGTENFISLKNPWDFGLKRDFFSADSPLVKSMTSTTIKTLDLYLSIFILKILSTENVKSEVLPHSYPARLPMKIMGTCLGCSVLASVLVPITSLVLIKALMVPFP